MKHLTYQLRTAHTKLAIRVTSPRIRLRSFCRMPRATSLIKLTSSSSKLRCVSREAVDWTERFGSNSSASICGSMDEGGIGAMLASSLTQTQALICSCCLVFSQLRNSTRCQHRKWPLRAGGRDHERTTLTEEDCRGASVAHRWLGTLGAVWSASKSAESTSFRFW